MGAQHRARPHAQFSSTTAFGRCASVQSLEQIAPVGSGEQHGGVSIAQRTRPWRRPSAIASPTPGSNECRCVVRKNQAKGRPISASTASVPSIRRCIEAPFPTAASGGHFGGRGIKPTSRRPRRSKSWMSKAQWAKNLFDRSTRLVPVCKKPVFARHEIDPVAIGAQESVRSLA